MNSPITFAKPSFCASLAVLLTVVFLAASPHAARAAQEAGPGPEAETPTVQCLLPGQIRRLSQQNTYLTPRQPAKIAAATCRLRGGEAMATAGNHHTSNSQ